MGKEDVQKQRVHVDLVGATNMGTSMANVSMKPKPKPKSMPKSKSIKSIAKDKTTQIKVAKKKAQDSKKPSKPKPPRPPRRPNPPKKKP